MTARLSRSPSVLCVGAVLVLAGCNQSDMVQQPKARVWDENSFFSDQSTMRLPVLGTVARDEPNQPAPQPAAITQAMLERGRERFDIFCTPCHGRSGDGQGMIVQRGFPAPAPLTKPALMSAKASDLYDAIAKGHGVMYSYADRLAPSDRWAIVSYIRALQLSQGARVSTLPAQDQAALERLP